MTQRRQQDEREDDQLDGISRTMELELELDRIYDMHLPSLTCQPESTSFGY